MNDNPNRRKDDARPAVALQWGDRPDHWTLLLTGPTSGMIGPAGSTWPNQPAELERVDVCVRRPGKPVAVYRTGGEGPATWQKFYPLGDAGQPLRDGEYLYREGAVPNLESIEQYRLQMAAIGTAAIGYWKLGDSINPDYDTVPLRDVAALYAKYAELHAFRDSVRKMTQLLKNREWAEDLAAGGDAAELQAVITELVGGRDAAFVEAAEKLEIMNDPAGDRAAHEGREMLCCETERMVTLNHAAETVRALCSTTAQKPDAVDAALADALVHGTGAFQVNGDGSTEHVDLQRDALHPGYAVPKSEQQEGSAS